MGGGEGTCLLEVEGRGEAVPCTPRTGGGAGVRAPRAGGGAGAYMPRMGGGCLAGACLPLTGRWGRAGTGACSPWMEGGDGTGALSHWTGGGGGAGACTPLTGRGGGAGAWSGGGAAPGPRSVAGVPGAPSPWLTSLTPLAPLRSPTPLAPLASPAPLVPLALPAPLALLTSPNPLPQLTSPTPLAPLVPSTPLPPLTSSAPNPAPAPAVFATTASAVVDPSVDGARATGMRERDRAGGLGGEKGGRASTALSAHASEFVPAVRAPLSSLNAGSECVRFEMASGVQSLSGSPAILITTYYCNARSLRNCLPSLHHKLYNENFQILCFSESWLCSKFSNSMLDPRSRYNIYRRDRTSKWPSGGVCTFIHKDLQSCLNCTDIIKFPDAEIVAADVHLNAEFKITVICSYIAPNLSYDLFEQSMKFLEKICSQEKATILLGDFNLPGIDWKNLIPTQDAKCKRFFDLCTSYGLNQYITEPTRIDNVLDLVFSNDRTLISDVLVGVPFGSSDHNSIIFTIVSTCKTAATSFNPIPILSWGKANWGAFQNYCQSLDWNELLQPGQTVDELWNAFLKVIKTGVNMFVPSSVYKEKIGKKKYTKSKVIRKLTSKKLKLWKKVKKNRSKANKAKYKNAAKQLKLATVSVQEEAEKKLIDSNNLGQFYKHVNKNSFHHTGIGPLKTSSDQLVLDDLEKAELLNSYFIDACTQDNGILPPLPSLDTLEENETIIDYIEFRTEQIKRVLKKLKRKTSSGPDDLPSILFNSLACQLASPLAKIYNCIMSAGKVPGLWKQARVIPIFKKGSSSSPKNYRPISLTCVGSKIFETTIKSVLVPFLEEKRLLSENQHGFRSKHSTCLNLLESLNDWSQNFDSKIDTFVAHIDFARAFDSVSLPKLIHKLKWAGVRGTLLACIESLLFGRTQQVKVGTSYSNPKSVVSGVPQGSVLGPTLFIFFINNITEAIPAPSTPKLYADDLKAYCPDSAEAGEKTFQDALVNITKWADTWQLPISSEKSKWLLLTNRTKLQSTAKFELAGVELPKTFDVVDLGINFNSKLNFNDHITAIITKAKQRLFLLKKIFVSRNTSLLILGFKTYVIPILEYCSQVWNPNCAKNIRRIESVQRMFTKKLAGYQGLNYKARLEKAGLCTLELRRLRADLCLCYKILHGQIDTPIQKFFELDNSRQTRGHNWKLKLTTSRLESRLHFYSQRVVSPWNFLSKNTVNATSFVSFKALLQLECLDKFLIIKAHV